MKRISVNTVQAQYEVIIGGSLAALSSFCNVKHGLIVAEEALNISETLCSLNAPVLLVPGGEALKTLSQIEKFYSKFLELELDKSSSIVAIGGGALTDAVAFAAATFHRGIPCITVPTTLLAQVDASIGGKNGVNFGGVKNIVGTIVQPKLVLCDLSFLATLPKHELSFGMAEIIKAGVIADASLIELLKTSASDFFALKNSLLENVISKAVQVKADIVGRDEKESNERMKLNFGHTIGHALETSCSLSHGEAVACGMVLETKLATILGLCSEKLVVEIENLCRLYDLPVQVKFDVDDVATRMLQDKKRRSEQLKFALPREIGKVEIVPVKVDEVKKYLSNLCSA